MALPFKMGSPDAYNRSPRSVQNCRVARPRGFAAGQLPPGVDHGFMWRLNSYWRFEERNGGVYIECEAISLSRGIPMLLSTLMAPILRQLPRESLEKTLLATRRALMSK